MSDFEIVRRKKRCLDGSESAHIIQLTLFNSHCSAHIVQLTLFNSHCSAHDGSTGFIFRDIICWLSKHSFSLFSVIVNRCQWCMLSRALLSPYNNSFICILHEVGRYKGKGQGRRYKKGVRMKGSWWCMNRGGEADSSSTRMIVGCTTNLLKDANSLC